MEKYIHVVYIYIDSTFGHWVKEGRTKRGRKKISVRQRMEIEEKIRKKAAREKKKEPAGGPGQNILRTPSRFNIHPRVWREREKKVRFFFSSREKEKQASCCS